MDHLYFRLFNNITYLVKVFSLFRCIFQVFDGNCCAALNKNLFD